MINRIAIVGGGLAGISAAKVLREEGFEGRLLLIGEEEHRPYDRPCLSKSVLAGLDEAPDDLAEPAWFDDSGIEFLPGCRVESLDLHARHLELEGGASIEVDRVLLATGARARKLDVPGCTLAGVHYLRTLDDSLAIRDRLKPGMAVVIVGGGLIGCEVATTARKIGAEVAILETADELLLRVMGPMLGAWCRRELEDMGVRVLLNAKAARLEGRAQVEALVTDANECIPAGLVLVSIGAEPAIDLASASGLACSKGILVNGSGATASPWIYAAGDAAAWPHRDGGCRSFETYLNSQAQSATAARALLGQAVSEPQIPLSWSELAGHRVQMIGDLAGPGELAVRGDPRSGAHLVFRIDRGQVVAAAAVDAARDFAAARRLVETRANAAPLSLSDLDIELRTLARATAGA